MIGVEENMWARTFSILVTVALMVPIFAFNHVEERRENISPLYSELDELLSGDDFPYVLVEKVVQPSTVFRTSAPPGAEPRSATVTLMVSGKGEARNSIKPQDTVFLIDNSGSMCSVAPHSDCNETRIDAIKQYMDIMEPEDRAAIVAFGTDCLSEGFQVGWGAWIVNDWGCIADGKAIHLTYMDKKGKEKLKDAAETLRWSDGSTNIEKAISMANWELIPGYTKRTTCLDYTRAYFPTTPPGGIANHTWVEILLTDGAASHNTNCVLEEIQDAVNAGIRIYTIGLGPFANGIWLENHISNPTGGKYYFADKPEDLPAIYMEIANDVEDRSLRPLPGSEPEVLDAIPKALNPTDFSPSPTAVEDWGSYLLVKWDLNQILRIGDSWQATYKVSSDSVGLHDVTVYNTAKVQYTAWDNNRTEMLIPSAYLNVTDATPPDPPTNVMAELAGFYHNDVRISWTLSSDDGSLVHEYVIYRSNVFEQYGNGYVLHDSVPRGTAEYVDTGAGDGDLSNHFYYVCAFNVTGIHSCSMNQVGKFTRSLSKGMSLISIPLIPADDRLGTVLQTVRFDDVWDFEYSGSTWTWRMVHKPYLGEMQKIEHTKGYWVRVRSDCRLTVAGVVPLTTGIRLQPGWNLVGFPSFVATYLVGDLRIDTGVTRIEGFDPTSPPYFLREMTDGESLDAGRGYWVRAESETLWVVYNT